jgi:hypothetical protein
MNQSTEALSVRGDFDSLKVSVEARIQQVSLDRRLQGPVYPKYRNLDQLTYTGTTFSKKYLDLIALILLCWYGNIFQGFESYILYEVRTYLEKNLIFPELAAACSAKEISLLIIISYSKKYSDRQLFGNILNADRLERVVSLVRLKLVSQRRPKRKIRHRGYRDHGSIRPEHQWKESYDWSFIEEQNSLEQKRSEYLDLVDLYVHRAGDWVLKRPSTEC